MGFKCNISYFNSYNNSLINQNSNTADSASNSEKDYWPELCIGIVLLSDSKKPISSREAMLRTVETSVLYQAGWKDQVSQDLKLVKQAIDTKDFELLGQTSENNALAMHATMLAAKPAICYSTKDTIEAMYKVWQLRQQGVSVYFTQDAGPNLKLIFEYKNIAKIKKYFTNLIISGGS